MEEEFSQLIRQGRLPPSKITAFVQDFKTKKLQLDYQDYIRTGRDIKIHGNDHSLLINAQKLSGIFRTFNNDVAALIEQVNLCIELRKDFTILLLSSSFNNPGVRQKVTRQMTKAAAHAKNTRGINIKHEFLRDVNRSRKEAYQYVPI